MTSRVVEKDIKVIVWKLRGKCGLDRFSGLDLPELHKN